MLPDSKSGGAERAWEFVRKNCPKWREFAKDTATWNIEKGFGLTIEDMIRAEATRTRIFEDMSEYFRDFDALLLPAAQVPPV